MKNIICTILFMLFFTNAIGQNSYSELIANGGFVDNPHKISGNELHFQIKDSVGTLNLSESDLKIIVNLDVSRAFNLGYSELEMKKHKLTKEYKQQLQQLSKLRKLIMDACWYYPIKLEYDAHYDVKNNGFKIEGLAYEVDLTYSGKNFINFDEYAYIQMNPTILKEERRYNYQHVLWQKKYFYLPLNNDDVAIDIERNSKDKYALIAMKIQKASSFTIKFSPVSMPSFSIDKDIMLFRPVGFYYIDKKTDKILYNASDFLKKYPVTNTNKRKK